MMFTANKMEQLAERVKILAANAGRVPAAADLLRDAGEVSLHDQVRAAGSKLGQASRRRAAAAALLRQISGHKLMLTPPAGLPAGPAARPAGERDPRGHPGRARI